MHLCTPRSTLFGCGGSEDFYRTKIACTLLFFFMKLPNFAGMQLNFASAQCAASCMHCQNWQQTLVSIQQYKYILCSAISLKKNTVNYFFFYPLSLTLTHSPESQRNLSSVQLSLLDILFVVVELFFFLPILSSFLVELVFESF